MKRNNIIRWMVLGVVLPALCWSCNDFLDENPDNRTVIDSSDKAVQMLVSAYADHQPWEFLEVMSDNTDNHSAPGFAESDKYADEIYGWAEPTQSYNASPKNTWEGQYASIASANQVLAAIEGMEMNDKLRAAKGEALMCRAFSHFLLVNIFAQQYDPNHPEDLGIPYMEHAETELDPKYERNTVHEVYALIEKDIEEGLPLVSDVNYTVPKYHFNTRAAHAFAARFYLYYQKWDKAIEEATAAISQNPSQYLRDFAALAAIPCSNGSQLVTVGTYYTGADLQCNFLLGTDYSSAGVRFGGYGNYKQYNHGQYIANTEGVNAPGYPYAASATAKASWRRTTLNFINGLDKILLPHIPYLFEYTDPVAGIGYAHGVWAIFTADETLLTRAEAYIMTNQLDLALADMQTYANNACSSTRTMTLESCRSWADGLAEYTPEAPTPKKALHPAFSLNEDQTALVHVLLSLRRYETLHCGLRWFDIKRFGIEIYRRTLTANNLGVQSVDDKLVVRDPRRAVQLPVEVISAGLEPNPR